MSKVVGIFTIIGVVAVIIFGILNLKNNTATKYIATSTNQSGGITAGTVNIGVGKPELKSINDRLSEIVPSELKPYLIFQLYPQPNKFGTKEYLKRDGNSNYFWDSLHNDNFLILPFKIKNEGKFPAVNIKAKYDSPTQSNVWFKIGENSILPDTETRELFHPWINISSLVNDEKIKEFEIVFKITYEGNQEIDSQVYFSLLKLQIMKVNKNTYSINSSNFNFGVEEPEDEKTVLTNSLVPYNEKIIDAKKNISVEVIKNFTRGMSDADKKEIYLKWIPEIKEGISWAELKSIILGMSGRDKIEIIEIFSSHVKGSTTEKDISSLILGMSDNDKKKIINLLMPRM